MIGLNVQRYTILIELIICRYLGSTGGATVLLSCLASPHDRIRDKAAYLICLLAFEDEGIIR